MSIFAPPPARHRGDYIAAIVFLCCWAALLLADVAFGVYAVANQSGAAIFWLILTIIATTNVITYARAIRAYRRKRK